MSEFIIGPIVCWITLALMIVISLPPWEPLSVWHWIDRLERIPSMEAFPCKSIA
jgi:uncharacterized protein (DUF983 family)